MKKNLLPSLLLAGACFTAPSLPAAVTLLGNLSGPGSYAPTYDLTMTDWAAVGLQISGPTDFTFLSLSGCFFGPTVFPFHPLPDAYLDGGIYSDNSGLPGTLLASFTTLTVPQDYQGTKTLTTPSSVILHAGDSYWFVLHDAFGHPLDWSYDSDYPNPPTAYPGTTFLSYRTSSDSGNTWSGPLSIYATIDLAGEPVGSVPEPGQIAASLMALLGVGGFVVGRRLHRQVVR